MELVTNVENVEKMGMRAYVDRAEEMLGDKLYLIDSLGDALGEYKVKCGWIETLTAGITADGSDEDDDFVDHEKRHDSVQSTLVQGVRGNPDGSDALAADAWLGRRHGADTGGGGANARRGPPLTSPRSTDGAFSIELGDGDGDGDGDARGYEEDNEDKGEEEDEEEEEEEDNDDDDDDSAAKSRGVRPE